MAPIKTIHYLRLRPGEKRVLLLFGDLLMGAIALLISLYFWALADTTVDFSLTFIQQTPPGWFFLLPLIWMILLIELYDEHRAGNWRETLRRITTAAVIGFILYALIFFTTTIPKSLPRRGIGYFLIAAFALTLLWRWFYISVFTQPQFMRRLLLVGAGETGRIILQITNEIWPPPFALVGIIDDDPKKIGIEIEGHKVLAGSERLLDIIRELKITDLIVAISGQMKGSMFQALLDAQEIGTEITRMPVIYEELLGRVPIRYLEADWILRSFVDQARVSGFYEIGKRIFDLLIASVGTILMLLVLPFIALAIVIDSGFPIFYTQVRSGRGGQPYHIIKFRTMRQNAEANGQPQWAEESDPRATRVGRILRKTHLDELPQFINVFRGEMSMVGPRAERPELVEWFQQHVPFYRSRLLVKPGITGWAQVNYGYASTIDETIIKLEYDLYYIIHRNLALDFLIMLRTPATVIGLQGR